MVEKGPQAEVRVAKDDVAEFVRLVKNACELRPRRKRATLRAIGDLIKLLD